MIQKDYIISNQWGMKLSEAELVELGGEKRATYMLKDIKAAQSIEMGQILQVSERRAYAEVYEGKVERLEGNEVTVYGLENISEELRQDFKYKCTFQSVITPVVEGLTPLELEERKKKLDAGIELEDEVDEAELVEPVEIVARDLSGSGIGFYSKVPCSLNPFYELVIPVMREPMVVRIKLLRCEFDPDTSYYLCGGRFVSLQSSEEALLRKTIMQMQVMDRRRLKALMEKEEEIDEEVG